MRTRLLGATALVIVGIVVGGPTAGPATAQSSCDPSSGASCPAPGARPTTDPTTLVGSTPPATSGRNLTGKGNLALASLLGKPTAVVFWLNSCPHCPKALAQINKRRTRLGTGAQIVTAAIDAGFKGPKGFATPAAAVKTLHLKVPTILVANDVAQGQWQVGVTPTAFIIDSGGVIRQVIQPGDAPNLAKAIQTALARSG